MSRAFADSIEGEAGFPVPLDAIKSTRFMKERIDMNTGKIEVTLGYDYGGNEDSDFAGIFSKKLQSMTDDQYAEFVDNYSKKLSDEERADLASMDRENGTTFMTTRAPKEGSGTFKYVPRTLSEYNTILRHR